MCLVYTPARPHLYTLNPTAWMVLELFRPEAESDAARARFQHLSGVLLTDEEKDRRFADGLSRLLEQGILEPVPAGKAGGCAGQ